MSKTVKVTVERAGDPPFTVEMDDEEPVSLAGLLRKARDRHLKWADYADLPPTRPTGEDPRVVTDKHAEAGGSEFHTLYPGTVFRVPADLDWLTSEGPVPRRLVLEPRHGKQLLDVLRPMQPKPGEPMTARELDELMGGGLLRAPPPPPLTFVPNTDLDSVLHDYRSAGKMAGVQVFSETEVVCWIGDIEKVQDHNRLSIRSVHAEPAPIFHKTTGPTALFQAARWLRDLLTWRPGMAPPL